MSDNLIFTLLGIDKLSDVFDNAGNKAKSLGDRLDDMGTVGLKSLGAVQAAALGSGVIAGGALAGLALTVGAAGVALVSNNEKVSESFTKLGTDSLVAMRKSAEPLTSYVDTAIGSVRTMVGQAQPLLAGMFRDAGPQLTTFTTGVNRLALNALPGMATAVKTSGAATEGMSSLMASTGNAVSGFFGNLSRGSADGGLALASLGRIVNTVLPAAGSGIASMASLYAANAPKIEGAITNVVAAIGNLGGGALPVMIQAAGVGLDVLDGLLAVLGPLSEDFGGLVGYALAAAAAIKVVGVATTGIKAGAATLADFAGSLKGATSGATGFSGKVGGLVGLMGGPLGIAITGVVAGLALLGAAQESTAEKTADHTTYVQALTTSLRESNGIIDVSTRKTVAADDSVKNAAKSAEQWGISSAQVVDAALGQGNAMEILKTKLQGIIKANTEQREVNTQGAGSQKTVIDVTNAQGEAAKKLLADLTGLNGGTKEAIDAASKYGAALLSSHSSLLSTTSSGTKLATAVTTLKDAAADATGRLRALNDAVDALNGGTLNFQDAQAKVNASLLGLGQLASETTDRTKGWGDALVNANGTINTLLPNGQLLYSQMKDLRENSISLAQATFDLSQRQGDSLPVSMDKARASMQLSRDEFLKLADGMDISKDKAIDLANGMNLVPDQVEIAIRTPNMTETQRELEILRGRVNEVPNQKSITVESLSDEARRKVEELGYKVSNLPNGKVLIESNTDPAWSGLNAFLNARVSKTVPVYYTSTGLPSPVRGQATAEFGAGAVVYPMAAGGLSNLRTADGGIAQFMPKNDLRIMGDRKDVVEVFAPLDGSVRTDKILRRANEIAGIDTGGSGGSVVLTAGGRGSVTNIIYASFPNATDAGAIRRALLELKRDNGGSLLDIA